MNSRGYNINVDFNNPNSINTLINSGFLSSDPELLSYVKNMQEYINIKKTLGLTSAVEHLDSNVRPLLDILFKRYGRVNVDIQNGRGSIQVGTPILGGPNTTGTSPKQPTVKPKTEVPQVEPTKEDVKEVGIIGKLLSKIRPDGKFSTGGLLFIAVILGLIIAVVYRFVKKRKKRNINNEEPIINEMLMYDITSYKVLNESELLQEFTLNPKTILANASKKCNEMLNMDKEEDEKLTPEARAKKRKSSGWGFWIALITIFGILSVLRVVSSRSQNTPPNPNLYPPIEIPGHTGE